MKRAFAWLLILTFFSGNVGPLGSGHAHADEVFTFIVKKQEEKKATRWSLAEWLETRDRMRLMDLWLAIHSPSPYEFFLGVDYQAGSETPGGSFGGFRGMFAAYASIFGLQAEVKPNEWHGIFNLRFFGFHNQGTNMTLQLGMRNRSAEQLRGALLGLSITIYLSRFFGLEGNFRHYYTNVPSPTGSTLYGNLYEGGAFIDFSFLRVYGQYFSGPYTLNSMDVGRSGFTLGTRLYF
ncbi:MAG: hypothetical protein AB7P04_07630 [Bacteriovoracia bacterium]